MRKFQPPLIGGSMGGRVRVLKNVPRISQECSRHWFQLQYEVSSQMSKSIKSIDLWEGTVPQNG